MKTNVIIIRTILIAALIVVLTSFNKCHSEKEKQLFATNSSGWYWVYEGIAHGQYFKANSIILKSIAVHVAKLNKNNPEGNLIAEIRDKSLKNIYAHGTISPVKSSCEFKWIEFALDHNAKIKKDTTYILLFYSKETKHNAPWILNATYKDIYPNGRHLAYDDDLFFKIEYVDGNALQVGPTNSDSNIPYNSGDNGGSLVELPIKINYPTPHSKIADNDPIGIIPEGIFINE
jgi:hypothetical protein